MWHLRAFADRAQSIVSTGLDRLGITEADDVVEELRSFDSIVSWYGTNRPEFRELTARLELPFTFHTASAGPRVRNACGGFFSFAGWRASGRRAED